MCISVTVSIMPSVLNEKPLLYLSSVVVSRPVCVHIMPAFPIPISRSRMLSKCSWSRCLSSELNAGLFIRLVSSAFTRSLTLFWVAASSAATGSVVVRRFRRCRCWSWW